MNITPEFRTSKEWKKYSKAIGCPAKAMFFLVNIYCEIEGITRKSKIDEAYLGTKDPEDISYMCGADYIDDEDYSKIIQAFLISGLMIEENEDYRMIGWEQQNANLIVIRRNGRKGGRPSNKQKETKLNVMEDNSKGSEHNNNGTERNVTDGLSPLNRGLTVGFEEREYPGLPKGPQTPPPSIGEDATKDAFGALDAPF